MSVYKELAAERWEEIQGLLQRLYEENMLCPGQERAGPADLRLSSVYTLGGKLGIAGAGPLGTAVLVFAGCPLRCQGCLYWNWAFGREGVDKDPPRISKILLQMQRMGRDRVVIMNASHHAHLLVPAIQRASENGFGLPLVWYTSGYENPDTLDLLRSVFDFFVIDLKTVDAGFAQNYIGFANYVDYAQRTLLWCRDNLTPVTDEKEPLPGYFVVRHLVLPRQAPQTRAVFKWVSTHLGNVRLELVGYVPSHQAPRWGKDWQQRVDRGYMERLAIEAREYGLTRVVVT